MATEADLQRSIQRAILTEYGKDAWVVKFHGNQYTMPGTPDLLLCVRGRFIALEVKRPGRLSTLTRLQQQHIDKIKTSGGHAAVATSVEEALKEVSEWLRSPLKK